MRSEENKFYFGTKKTEKKNKYGIQSGVKGTNKQQKEQNVFLALLFLLLLLILTFN